MNRVIPPCEEDALVRAGTSVAETCSAEPGKAPARGQDPCRSLRQHELWKSLHWIYLPVIVCALGFAWAAPFPSELQSSLPAANWAGVIVLAAVVYYAFL
jgi:hypothetical protein